MGRSGDCIGHTGGMRQSSAGPCHFGQIIACDATATR